ncbi:RNA polymerase sigma factor [Streptomyces sp. GQFP]|uniref:RNA polymerase sigma factor n=1 Tax=Streptomyces sp. GQFP TaxID=2907545 RepID=UPI001F2BE427|nr:RNA polymerase sigma factor [Streptomyces sp. GQFP]UIX32447.1 RNA polymerase sigma factor [Streptomyces sp. GQFP]
MARSRKGVFMWRASTRQPAPESGAPDGEPADEGELFARSARDPAAFEPLVARHSVALHGYFARRAPAAADDLLSEVWLQAYTSRLTFDSAKGTLRTWLFGVARNVLAAHWRDSARERPEAEPERFGRTASVVDADPWHAVDQRLDAAALAPLVRGTLAGLPHVERELLLLVAWEQLTPTEAAAVLGIPPGTARSRLHRARSRLREALDPDRAAHASGTSASPSARTPACTSVLRPTGDPA